jgi:hypothetical protein
MAGNLLLAFLSLLMGISPFISRIPQINEKLGMLSANRITGRFELFVFALGALGLAAAIHSLFIGAKRGAPHIVLGLMFLFVAFFYNDETLPRPLSHVFMGGDMFFAFLVAGIWAIAGAVVEYLT